MHQNPAGNDLKHWSPLLWVGPYMPPGLPRWCYIKEPAYQCRRLKSCGSCPLVGKIPWRRKWQPTLEFLPKESHGQRSLARMVHGTAKSWTWLKWICTYTGTYAKGTINSTCLPSTRATDMTVSSNGTSSVHLFLGTWPQAPFSLPGNEMLPNQAVVAKQPQASYTPAFYANGSNKKQ